MLLFEKKTKTLLSGRVSPLYWVIRGLLEKLETRDQGYKIRSSLKKWGFHLCKMPFVKVLQSPALAWPVKPST